MVDFVKLYYGDKERFENFVMDKKNFEDVDTVFSYHTGEVKYPYKTKLGSMDVVVLKNSGYVKNSLHKLYNYLESKEEHNHNDFPHSKICETVGFLFRKMIDAKTTKLTQLEFGFNLEIDRTPETLIRRNVLMHQYKGGTNNTYHGRGELRQFDHNNYFIKVYDKGKQFELDTNILRFEMKFIKAKEFQKLGIYKLADLEDKSNLRRLFIYLLNRFDELMIVDDYDDVSISSINDYSALSRFTNPNYWTEEIKHKHQQFKSRQKKQFEMLLKKNDLLNTKAYLRTLLVQKFIQLINN